MDKKSIIDITVSGKEFMKKLEYLLGFKTMSVDPTGTAHIHVEVRDGVGVGDETAAGATHDPAGNSTVEEPTTQQTFGGQPRVPIDVAIYDPHRFGCNASELPYKTSAAYAAIASRNLTNYERKYRMAYESARRGQRMESLMPEFTNDIGRVVIPLAETILRIPNGIARRDFICAFLGYYAARSYGYTLDYDSIDDLMEIWRREKDHTGDNSSMTQGLQELLSRALETLSQPLIGVMRVDK